MNGVDMQETQTLDRKEKKAFRVRLITLVTATVIVAALAVAAAVGLIG